MADSPEERERIKAKIGARILEFYRIRRTKPVFYTTELQAFVRTVAFVVPDSVTRCLRQLRQEGQLDYKVTGRAEYTFFYQDA